MGIVREGWEEVDMTDNPVSVREPGVMCGPEPGEKHADVLGGFEPGRSCETVG